MVCLDFMRCSTCYQFIPNTVLAFSFDNVGKLQWDRLELCPVIQDTQWQRLSS